MNRPGFTLVEILMALAVIGILMGLALPVYGVIQASARRRATVQLVGSVAAAIASSTGGSTVRLADGGVRRRWDFNGDLWLDGDPARDDLFSGADRSAAAAASYEGTIIQLGVAVPKRHVDGQGRIIDGWSRVLRIEFSQELYGKGGFGLWSLGKDGQDQQGSGDDIASWKQP